MKCIRIVLPLLVAFVAGTVALGSNEGPQGFASEVVFEMAARTDGLLEDDQAEVAKDWCENTVVDDDQGWTDNDSSAGNYGDELQEDFDYDYEEEAQYATDAEYVYDCDDYDDYEADYADDYRDAYEGEEPTEDYTCEYEHFDSECAGDDMDEREYSYDYEDYAPDCDHDDYDDAEWEEEQYNVADHEEQYDEEEETYGEYDYEAAYGDWGHEEEGYCEGADEDIEAEGPIIVRPVDDYHGFSEAYPEKGNAYPGYEGYGEYEYELEVYEYGPDSYEDEAGSYETSHTGQREWELSTWLPTELLTWDDEDLVGALHSLGEVPSGMRRAVLNHYVKSQGWEAIWFVTRLEDITGIGWLGLADDVRSVATMLGAFRLVEQGEFHIDDGVAVLEEALDNFSEAWIDEVTETTWENAEEEWEGSVPARTALNAVLDLTADSLEGIGETFCGMSRRISSLKQ